MEEWGRLLLRVLHIGLRLMEHALFINRYLKLAI